MMYRMSFFYLIFIEFPNGILSNVKKCSLR